jgi:hypothetical protein
MILQDETKRGHDVVKRIREEMFPGNAAPAYDPDPASTTYTKCRVSYDTQEEQRIGSRVLSRKRRKCTEITLEGLGSVSNLAADASI